MENMQQPEITTLDSLCTRVDSNPIIIPCTDDSSISSPVPSICSSNTNSPVLMVFKDIKAELKYKGYSSFYKGTELFMSVKINMPNSTNSRLLQFETLSTPMVVGPEREIEIDSLLGEFTLNFPIQLTFGVHPSVNVLQAATAGCMVQDFDVVFNQDTEFRDLPLFDRFGVQCGYVSFQIGVYGVEYGNEVVQQIANRRLRRASQAASQRLPRSTSVSSLLATQSPIILEEEGRDVESRLEREKVVNNLFNDLDQFYVGKKCKFKYTTNNNNKRAYNRKTRSLSTISRGSTTSTRSSTRSLKKSVSLKQQYVQYHF